MNNPQKNKVANEIIRLRLSQLFINEDYRAGKFKVPIHLALGHEAIATAVGQILKKEDRVLLTHRNMAYHLALGATFKELRDEYLMKAEGLAHGRFGSMNLINPARGAIYTSSILGNQFPVAVGVALGRKVLGEKGVTIVLGGDGSMEEGSLYESFLMARSVNAPVLFLIENNEWSMHTKIDERRTPVDLKKLAESLGIEYIGISGNNVFSYIETLSQLRSESLKSQMPFCLEVKVSTLGDWRGPKNEEFPEGKFINYHAGPTPSVKLNEWPIIRENEQDPLFVLKNNHDEKILRTIAKKQFLSFKKEV